MKWLFLNLFLEQSMEDHMKKDSKKSLIHQFQLLFTGINFKLHFEKEDFKRYIEKEIKDNGKAGGDFENVFKKIVVKVLHCFSYRWRVRESSDVAILMDDIDIRGVFFLQNL